jgi:hypothetical protein
MKPPRFLKQIERVRRRLAWRRALAGFLRVFAIVGCATMGLMIMDRLADMAVVRLSGTICLFAMLLWAVRRYLVLGSRGAFTSLDVALALEQRDPRLTDMVSSAVQFAREGSANPRAGSRQLRQAVIQHAAEGLQGVDWKELVQRHPLRRTVEAAILVASIFGLSAWGAPQMTRIGLVRLLNPLAAAEWPRKNHLAFIDPPRLLAAKSRFQLALVDRHGILPPLVQLQIRSRQQDYPGGLSDQGSWRQESVPMIRSGNRMIVHRMTGNRPFEFRACGGDDRRMPWHRVEVQPRPVIDAVQVTVHPPDYTELPPTRTDPPYRMLAGSRIELAGQTSTPLSRLRLLHPRALAASAPGKDGQGMRALAALAPGKDGQGTSADGHEIQTTELVTDGHSFYSDPQASDPWLALQSGPAWFEMTTLSGLVVRELRPLSLQVIADNPPEVALLEPRGNRSVVADAQVDLRIAIQDDLALADVSIICQTRNFHKPSAESGEAGASILESRQIWSDPPDLGGAPKQTRQIELSTTLQLADWHLRPGQTILVNLAATDYCPLKFSTAAKNPEEEPLKGQIGRLQRPLRLTIVSKDQLIYQLHTQQARLLATLTRARDLQRQAKRGIIHWPQPTPEWRQAPAEADDTLRQQRQVARLLVGTTPSNEDMLPQNVAAQIDAILSKMQTNQQAHRELEKALATIRASLIPQVDSRLSEIEQQLSDWIKGYGENRIRRSEADGQQALDSITRNQQTMIDQMDQWLAELTRAGALQQIAQKLFRLSEDQLRLLQTCQLDIGPKMWGAEGELGQRQPGQPQFKASGRTGWLDAIRDQRNLSIRFGSVLTAMRESVNQQAKSPAPISSQPAATANAGGDERLARALADARRYRLQSELQTAADDLAAKRIGRSMTRQQQIADRLQQMADQLSGEDQTLGKSDAQTAASDSTADSRPGEPASTQAETNPTGAGKQAGSGASPADRQSAATDGPLQTDELQRMHALIHGLWGQLPERERMEIMQPVGATFLPRYAPEIEQYYRRMAEAQR